MEDWLFYELFVPFYLFSRRRLLLENPWVVLKGEDQKPVFEVKKLVFDQPCFKEKIKKSTNRLLRWGPMRKLNRFTSDLLMEDFILQNQSEVEIKYIDSLIGYGVFSNQVIPALKFVGEYVGIVRRRDRKKDRDDDYIFRYIRTGLFQPLVVDAEECGNFTRFINHSLTPNLSSRWIVHEGIYHIVFMTNRLVKKGEQLTYNYGPGYWSQRANPLEL